MTDGTKWCGLELADLCLLAIMQRAEAGGGEIGSDEDLTETVVALLQSAGMDERAWSWQLGADGRWYLEQVAAYTSRLMDLGWAIPARHSALTSIGMKRCTEMLQMILNDPDKGPQLQCLANNSQSRK